MIYFKLINYHYTGAATECLDDQLHSTLSARATECLATECPMIPECLVTQLLSKGSPFLFFYFFVITLGLANIRIVILTMLLNQDFPYCCWESLLAVSVFRIQNFKFYV